MRKLFTKFYFLLSCKFILSIHFVNGQQYHYKHYDNNNGLAGNTVYCIDQDAKGYLWFATDNGLSRYDGKFFKTFTTKDGLPDNEVLKIFSDSYGRVWISTFNKNLCYYSYDGLIHTNKNDSLLKAIELQENILTIFESPEKKVYMQTTNKVVEITKDKKANVIEVNQNRLKNSMLILDYNIYLNSVVVYIHDSLFMYKNKALYFIGIESQVKHKFEVFIKKTSTFQNSTLKKPYNFISANGKFGVATFINTSTGSYVIDTTKLAISETFLKDQRVSYTFEDKEKNLWFGTLGNGVFKLKSRNIKFYPFDTKENNSEVYAVSKFNNKILAGISFGKAYSIEPATKNALRIMFPDKEKFSPNSNRVNRLTSILPITNSTAFFGFDSYLLKLEKGVQKFAYIKPVKSLSLINDKTILVGTSGYAIRMHANDLSIIDTIYNDRCTKVSYFNNDYYIGTQNGLFVNNKKFGYLNERITELVTTNDSILWIGTNSSGVFGMKNKKIVFSINEKNGLTGNNIKCIYANGSDIWIGTFNGLNKYNRLTNKITTYTIDDGLPSNIINAIYAEKNMLWLGTNVGLVSFDEQKIDKTSFCNIDLISIQSSNRNIIVDKIELAYNQNNIKFEHNGISFKSESSVVFKYKMEGLDSAWNVTISNVINYPSLPSGNYNFKIYAINKFNVKSKILSYTILVKRPFWGEPLFVILTTLALITITSLAVFKYVQRIKKRNEEKTKSLKELHYAKQMALQTQMNPHFIFNCLNNIQKFVFKNDVESTNKYLTEFATLIRITLENADKIFISLTNEVDYLNRYLHLEKLRFGNKLTYNFNIHKNVDANSIEIPTMLLQPFIENSLKHGILNKKEGIGIIDIEFFAEKNYLNCVITDNGIGRIEATKIKLSENQLFESKGIEITNRRIEMLNINNSKKISLQITDLYDKLNNPRGTNVHILIPLNLYETY